MAIHRLHRAARHTFAAAAAATLAITAVSTQLSAQCFRDTDHLPACTRPSPTDKPALLVEGNNLHVFVKGTDQALWHALRTGLNARSPWSAWESLGGVLLSGPAVSLRPGTTIIDVFVRGGSNHLYHLTRTGGTFSTFEDLRGIIDSDPASVSWAANRIDVFARNATTKSLDHLSWNGASWAQWESLGGGLAGGPSVASWAPNRLDVFVAGVDTRMYHKSWSGGPAWSEYDSEGCCIIGTPAAYTAGNNSLFITALGTDGRLFAQTYTGSWTGWAYELSKWAATSSPAVAYHNGATEIVAMGSGGLLMQLLSNGPGSWAPWQPLMSGPYLTDIKFSSNRDYDTALAGCPAGYTRLPQDLNEGAGGDFIFACTQWGSSRADAILNLGIQVPGGDSNDMCPTINGWTIGTDDLNKGSGGEYLYLCAQRDQNNTTPPLSNIGFQIATANEKAMGSATCNTGSESVRNGATTRRPVARLNGSSGKFIIMCMFRTAP